MDSYGRVNRGEILMLHFEAEPKIQCVCSVGVRRKQSNRLLEPKAGAGRRSQSRASSGSTKNVSCSSSGLAAVTAPVYNYLFRV
ncbi:hypothetical protein [Paenibacillus polymyxa]|uniref:hypothetical protein n=1 Tax=Paenibacillus polymyxa TaxID=1406 RepID=UPI00160FB0B5|nr:hypothetical protein [Paenibacillus polymyxa]